MDLTLNDKSRELLENLDTLYQFYQFNKLNHLEIVKLENKKIEIDHILIATHLSLSDAPLPFLNKVYIKKSKVDGLGVFAKEDLKKGEIVSMYPSDIVRIYHGKQYYEQYNVYCNDYRYAYKTELCTIMGVPSLIDNTNLVGHIVNDYCKTDGSETQNYIYNHLTHENRNCKYYPYHIFILIVTTKDIKKGDELFVPYGIDYWSIINS